MSKDLFLPTEENDIMWPFKGTTPKVPTPIVNKLEIDMPRPRVLASKPQKAVAHHQKERPIMSNDIKDQC
jgi:hypothetical protein